MSESSWGNFYALINGVKAATLRGIQAEKESDDELLYAQGSEPISIQSGNKAYRGTIKLLKSGVDALNRAAQALGYNDITEVENLVFVAVHKPIGQTVPLQTDTYLGAKISKLTKGWDQGAKFMEVELPFLYLRLKTT